MLEWVFSIAAISLAHIGVLFCDELPELSSLMLQLTNEHIIVCSGNAKSHSPE